MKAFFTLLTAVVIGAAIWFVFALWAGLYSVYSYPPSKEHSKGVTLIVKREEGEPVFNSPDYVDRQGPAKEKQGGIGFEKAGSKQRRPLKMRTVVELPYVEWAYKKSLEVQKVE
jgi:hypothetical protein